MCSVNTARIKEYSIEKKVVLAKVKRSGDQEAEELDLKDDQDNRCLYYQTL